MLENKPMRVLDLFSGIQPEDSLSASKEPEWKQLRSASTTRRRGRY
jgi:hypothetical protein